MGMYICRLLGSRRVCLPEHLPKIVWHSIEVYEPSTIFESKVGKYVAKK